MLRWFKDVFHDGFELAESMMGSILEILKMLLTLLWAVTILAFIAGLFIFAMYIGHMFYKNVFTAPPPVPAEKPN